MVYSTQTNISLTTGFQIVSMFMYGSQPDSWGFLIHKVTLQQLLPIKNNTYNTNNTNTTNNTYPPTPVPIADNS